MRRPAGFPALMEPLSRLRSPPGPPNRMRAGRLFAEWLSVGVALSLLVTALAVSGLTDRVDKLLYDYTIAARPLAPPDSILIIGIDEASLAAIGPWPWPRQVHAEAIARLNAAGAAAIGYDVLFTEPHAGDDALSAAIAASVPVVLPMQFRVPGSNGAGYDAIVPVVGKGAARVGHSSLLPDSDGVVRTLDLAIDGARRWPHVALLLSPQPPQRALPPLVPLVPRPATAPLRREGERLLGYRGGAGAFRRVPFSALLAGEIPREAIAGRTVLVGATAAGLGDQFSTPGAGSSGLMPGVEIEANFLADLIERRDLRRAGPLASVLLALAVLWLGMLGLLRLRPAAAAIFGAVLALWVLLFAGIVFHASGLWIAPAAAMAGVLLGQPFWAWRRLAVVNRWMLSELAELGRLGGVAEATPGLMSADPVTRTTTMLDSAIDRVDSLRELAFAAIRGLPDATVLIDRGGNIAATNTASEALFGVAPTLTTIDACFTATSTAPASASAPAPLPPLSVAALGDAASPWRGEHHARDGSIRDIRFTPWRASDGTPLGWIVRFADITALRRAEMAREEALQLLTHDMRTPQATILALLDANPGLDAALAARLRHLAHRTVALADGYLHLASADAGAYPMAEVDLAAIVTEAIDELWPQSHAKGLRITASGLTAEALLTGNHQLLLRAAINLIGNAVKFSPGAAAIDVAVAADGVGWRLDVRDNGPGLTAEVQSRLFGRFRTGPSAAGSDGVGLGLAFVKSVAQGHGGRVTCHSVEGAGATFSLWLPGLSAAPAAPPLR